MLWIKRVVNRRSKLRHEEKHSLAFGLIHSDRFGFGAVADRGLYDRGITLRNELPDLDCRGNAIYSVPMEHTTRVDRLRRQREEAAQRVAPLASRDGVRASLFLTVASVLFLVLGMWWLMNMASTSSTYKNISELQARIEAADADLAVLSEEYAAAVKSVDVPYGAVSLGMMPTRNSNKIYLYAPEEALNGPMEVVTGLRTNQLATITGD